MAFSEIIEEAMKTVYRRDPEDEDEMITDLDLLRDK
jgi:hypothetical protein